MKDIFFFSAKFLVGVESESEIHFRQPESETLDKPEKPIITGLSEISCAG